ncbi:MAG: cyclic nucleotide-binding protein [Arcobacter sp.]|nr:MAG: cyclic nucleotide-binding protein [Arcobacter sp.]
MSIYDQQQLLASVHPFSLLKAGVIETLSGSMDIAYYPKESVLISKSIGSDYLYIIIKGIVHEYLDDELHNVYNESDSFDANALIYSDIKSHFVVQEDLICYLLPKEIFLNLIQDHQAFKDFYMKDFIAKHQSLKEHELQNDLTPFMMAKVSDIYLHVKCLVPKSTSIYTALQEMQDLRAKAIIVQDNEDYGIVTDSDLRQRLLLAQLPLSTKVKDIASFPLICIAKSDFLFNALLMFLKHDIKRMAVLENGEIVGILEQLDLLSHFANHSHLIAVQVQKASSIQDLQKIQKNQLYLVESLQARGVKTRYISKLVSELNAKIYTKVYQLSVPLELQNKAALILMGSEGRQEQILHTDQDNALIIDDDTKAEIFEPFMLTFSSHLQDLGFPPCPGNIMVSNTFWRRNKRHYKEQVDIWVDTLNSASLQELSIFSDALYICGNENLLNEVKTYLHQRFIGREDILAHLAKSALSFETPLSLFSNFVTNNSSYKNEIDLKKGGIFAIVHGIRTLCLEYNITNTNTILRIKELNNKNIIDKNFATELVEAFDTLLSMRLKAMLKHPNDYERANFIDPSKLEKYERDLLKDAFKVVNSFKKFLSFHFHLNVVT